MPSHVDDVAMATNTGIAVDQKNQHQGTGNEYGQTDVNQDATTSTGLYPPVAKKKKGRKTTAQRGPTALPRNRGTGFEGVLRSKDIFAGPHAENIVEYFADPPMTPDEAEEEKLEIYAPCFPFEERIQSCIQRFRSRRRLQNEQTSYFNEYLFLGGIDTSASAFSGNDTNDLKELTPAQRREATATDTVNSGTDERFYNGDDEHWDVDFAGVAAGFFSTSLSQQTGFEPEKTEALISIVENFLRYVLHHEVCPEYTENIESALQVCQQAREEWPALNQLGCGLPGNFNLAATELFSSVTPGDWSFLSFSRPDGFDPKMTFLTVCALRDEPATLEGFIKGSVKVLREYSCSMQVVTVERPSRCILDLFSALQIDGIGHNVDSVGKVFFKPAMIEDEWEKPEVSMSSTDTKTWVYLEDSLLANIVPKMKMDITFIELDTGITFIKTISRIVPSFYTFLPQQMMRHYKRPREADRPAPSVHNPLAEDVQLGEEAG